ncbi:hypothetical protein FG386_001101 [Cryptosporidium ryanae]|uniref:uncharacterized protein n=1 Tax=Cryptosporidium ryanae TaxID=515981 RepID=UPI00351A80CA|nr:hypothetical protein FG386_001101 [Cryptosporidium ryanae]
MKHLFSLLLFTIGCNSLLYIRSDDQIGLSGVNGSYSSNNLKVNNQMRVKGEIVDNNFVTKTGIVNKSRDIATYKKDYVKGMSEEYNIGSNSLRTSDIIYNGTQVITLLLFIMVLFVGLFILVIIVFPRYAKKFGLKQKNGDDNTYEQELSDISLQEESDNKNNINSTVNSHNSKVNKFESINSGKVIPNKDLELNVSDSNSKNQIARNLGLTLNKSRNYSLRRHSLISDGSSDNCKIVSRPRSSSSLPFVQPFTDTIDESTTGDESTSRVSKGTTFKNLLKKRNNQNSEIYGNNNNKVWDNSESSRRITNNSLTIGDEEESNNSPTSASAVVAIQMSELLARWNPKKDSRLIQKSNFLNNMKNTNNNITFDKLGNRVFFSNYSK